MKSFEWAFSLFIVCLWHLWYFFDRLLLFTFFGVSVWFFNDLSGLIMENVLVLQVALSESRM